MFSKFKLSKNDPNPQIKEKKKINKDSTDNNISQEFNKTKILFQIDNDVLSFFKEQADHSSQEYQQLINQFLKEYINNSPETTCIIEIRDKDMLIFRLQDLVNKGRNIIQRLRQGKQLDAYSQCLAWLTAVMNLLELSFKGKDIAYVRAISTIISEITPESSLEKFSHAVYLLEELLFDLQKNIFIFQ